ncbi:hypothetical protein J5N97_017296 [Dioscorea zingiberensis]|uniref:Endonuclease/exonuclease/phosphatase domain-containing protein n=1 Tax=Dioscorea zingiberensis TaxID=325984 RepID=A0A9D5HG04_9LILI|nr:hypothetical protein J5N97_017296 [Dioscorea zingiberensis]
MGDFNAILNINEHRGGAFDHYSIKSIFFGDFVSQTNLFDLGFYGPPFTWCNNQGGLARRWARLDRFLANNAWLTNFSSYCNKHLPRTASDHSPLFLSAKLFSHQKNRIFRFENFWFEHESCHQAVCKAWNHRSGTSPMHDFNHNISHTRNLLSKWKSSGLTSLDRNITQTEEDISTIEALEPTLDYSDLSTIALRGLYNKHQALLRQNSIKWAQRARLMWLKHGDYNTSFFHNQAQIRGHKNKISAITNEQDQILTDQQDIGREFINFYATLWGSTSKTTYDELTYNLPPDLPSLSDEDNTVLIDCLYI